MAKRSEKNNWKKKRRQEYLEKKEFRYYIFCEGQATEPFYFQGFKQYMGMVLTRMYQAGTR